MAVRNIPVKPSQLLSSINALFLSNWMNGITLFLSHALQRFVLFSEAQAG